MVLFQNLFLRCKNFFFPPRCIFCRRLLALSADVCVCTRCMSRLPFYLAVPGCQVCGRPVHPEETLCFRCAKGFPNHFRKVFAAYLYTDQPKRAVIRFKWSKHRCYAPTFAAHMAAVLQSKLPNQPFDLVVAVPPRKLRMLLSGYDQTKALGIALAKRLEIPFLSDALRQKTFRKKQSTLTFRERWHNAKGNFVVVKNYALEGKHILLVDDICTTGATLTEYARILKAAGALSVTCSVVAISCPENNS